MEWVFNSYYTLIAATVVLLVGRLMVAKIKFLQDFNIPEPVAGGLVAAAILYALHAIYGVSFKFEKPLQDAFMLIFFTSIGLSADFSRLKAGGFPLVIFTAIVGSFIMVQNTVGVGLASLFGLDPLIGLITGSITLTGGHGTAGAWGPDFEKNFGLTGATGLGMAAATFGLVAGGLIGGPVARRLINKMGRKPLDEAAVKAQAAVYDDDDPGKSTDDLFEHPEQTRLITANSAVETLAMFAACLAFAEIMDGFDSEYLKPFYLDLPKFVWALFGGVILRNILTSVFKFNMFDRAIDVFGNASLSLFLAMALLNLKLWELTGLAGPVTVILLVQTVVMMLYATFVTYVLMGRNYDSAVLAAGHCGFGLGATPTAVANMQSVTERFGPSHKAFLIVPMVGAFFVDFINVFILTGFVNFLK
ncbi:sodium/glutamate symporter [Neisseria dentiae]|uniref:Sodium/glutamate symporter n=2 Tax=Neisseria dentiae TaxID=194197 RepID=A0A1X3DEZ2_9NEIS|nr:sodium/glutamate symporter [Neisseria dentiae]MCQ9326415.1 sodium/glutamate symporter [Neisseria dentiae]OSI18291.1 sodium/glutamate symporter [Neisseria dentiae]QMT44476.1 sodium/glutamate symporter [Neisseria dentiae]STZ50170.1 glutamate permease [Neisseria dentiae]